MLETRECKWCYTVGPEAVYSFPVRFLAAEDIRCFLLQNGEERELTAGTEFRVEVKADYSTGANITLLLDPLPQGATLAILRDTPKRQLLSLPEFGKLPAVGIELALDKLTMIVQELDAGQGGRGASDLLIGESLKAFLACSNGVLNVAGSVPKKGIYVPVLVDGVVQLYEVADLPKEAPVYE